MMGSGAEAAEEAVEALVARARKSGWSRCACTGRSRLGICTSRCRSQCVRLLSLIAPRKLGQAASRCTSTL